MDINTTYFDQTLSELFRDTSGEEWSFTNDASGADLNIMRFNNNPFAKLQDMPNYNNLPDFVQQKLAQNVVFSKSEVKGWDRIEFDNQRLIDMFGSDVIYTQHDDKNAAFYKALSQWFDEIPYGTDEQGHADEEDSFELNDTKTYGLTSSLLSIFGNENNV